MKTRDKTLYAVVVLSVLLLPAAAESAEHSADAVDKAWAQRGAQAKERLAGSGLDACDKGLEQAFASARKMPGKDGVYAYALNIEVSNQTMQAAYYYNRSHLTNFVISLPDKWLAVQKPDSKTLSFVVAKANCALDLCTDNPLAAGLCRR